MKTFVSVILLFAVSLLGALGLDDKIGGDQRLFETPIAAADALVDAVKTGDNGPLLQIFGTKHKDLIGTVDEARDRELRARVANMALERRRFRFNDDGSLNVVVGFDAWVFPIPIVTTEGGWRFDTDSGINELVKRRIGENELTAITAMRAYVDAQRQYAAAPRDGTEVRQFSQKFESSPEKKDGLYWHTKEGEAPCPAGPEIKGAKTPYAGYRFKIVTAQGATAPGGKYNYIINGKLIAGFALVAWPADYGKTGVMTLLVNHYGDVYQKNLGPSTAKLAAAMIEYNPDKSWNKVSE